MSIENHRRDGDEDAETCVVQRYRDAMSKLLWIRRSRALRAKNLDHADDRAEQAHQRCDRSDGAQAGEEALQLMRDAAPRFFDGFLHGLTCALDVAQTRCQYAPQRRVPGHACYQLLRCAPLAVVGHDALQQSLRHNLASAQRD